MVVPADTQVKLSALAAENHLREAVIAGEATFPSGRADMYCPTADKLSLHLHEELLRDDGFVVILDVVLRDGAVILDTLLCKEVRGVSLLKQGVAHILLVAEDLVDGAGVPLRVARAGLDAVSHKSGGNLVHAGAFEVFPIDAFYDFCLLRVGDEVPVLILGVSEEAITVDLHFSLLVAVLTDLDRHRYTSKRYPLYSVFGFRNQHR